MTDLGTLKQINAGQLSVAYYEAGPSDGAVAVLSHGFPYAPQSYARVVPRLTAKGLRVIVPFLRGYGPTRFLSDKTPRSGEQAALGADLLALMNALQIHRAVLGGYDWGGRASCVVAALWPERVAGLVSCGCTSGYNIQDIARSAEPAAPELEASYWYQYYFHTERGVNGLTENRRGIGKLLWKMWSPNWAFDDATYDESAIAFDNPDFVDVVIHSYRHRYGIVPGDPSHAKIEAQLATQPEIPVPTIILQGEDDTVDPSQSQDTIARHFTGPYLRHLLPGIGHNPPQEAPEAFADAILKLAGIA